MEVIEQEEISRRQKARVQCLSEGDQKQVSFPMLQRVEKKICIS